MFVNFISGQLIQDKITDMSLSIPYNDDLDLVFLAPFIPLSAPLSSRAMLNFMITFMRLYEEGLICLDNATYFSWLVLCGEALKNDVANGMLSLGQYPVEQRTFEV